MRKKLFQTSNIDMLLLRILMEKYMYGYELMQTLENMSNSIFVLKAGNISFIAYIGKRRAYSVI